MPKIVKKEVQKLAELKKRPVLHPKVRVEICEGDKALTADRAKALLGWEEEPEKGGWGDDFLCRNHAGKKIRCKNNPNNRPYQTANSAKYKQEILRKKWRFNLEDIIIGRTGLILNGQHRLIALILAVEEWLTNQDNEKGSPHELWETEPTIEVLIAYGCAEDDDTVNTMDTAKPRSLTDVIARSELFATMTKSARLRAASVCEHAVKILWHRTGCEIQRYNAFAKYRTHAESLAFIARHKKILECVKHICEEDGSKRRISKFIGPGAAAAFMYLMACSATDPKKYREEQDPDESLLTWSMLDQASEFWVLFASDSHELSAAKEAIVATINNGNKTQAEKNAVIAKAWTAFVDKLSPVKTVEMLKLHYSDPDEDGFKKWIFECPVFGGIDLGDPENADEEDIVADDPTQEQIAERSEEVKPKSTPKTLAAKKETDNEEPKSGKSSSKQRFKKNSTIWVKSANGEHWQGRVIESANGQVKVTVAVGHAGAGTQRSVDAKLCSVVQPGVIE